MPSPLSMNVTWVPELYDHALRSRVQIAFDRDPEMIAIVNRVTSRDGIDRSFQSSGGERLANISGARRIQAVAGPPGGLLDYRDGHGYKAEVPYPDVGPGYLLLLHRDMVVVLPADPRARRRRRDLEDYFSGIILEAPRSNHQKISLPQTLRTIATDARALLDYVWPHGIDLIDQTSAAILPSHITALHPAAA